MATLSELKKADLEKKRLEAEALQAKLVAIEEASAVNIPEETIQSLFTTIAKEKKEFDRIKASTLSDFASILKESGSKNILKAEEIVHEQLPEIVEDVPELVEVSEEPVQLPEPETVEEKVTEKVSFDELKTELSELKKSIKEFVLKTERELKSIKLTNSSYSSGGGGAVRLEDLDDVDARMPNDNDVIAYSASAGKFVSKAPSGGGTVDETIYGIAGEQIDQYDFCVFVGSSVMKATSVGMRDLNSIVYIATSSGNTGTSISLRYDATISVPLGFSAGSRILLGIDGVGNQGTQTPGTSFIKQIAVAVSSTSIRILTEPSTIRFG